MRRFSAEIAKMEGSNTLLLNINSDEFLLRSAGRYFFRKKLLLDDSTQKWVINIAPCTDEKKSQSRACLHFK